MEIRRGRIGSVALAALVVVFLAPAAADAGRPIEGSHGCRTQFCANISEDGARVVFPSGQELVAGAGPNQLYEWEAGALRPLLAPGLAQDWRLELAGASADATHVFVSTGAALSPEDLDGSGLDIYDLFAGTATLVSTGPRDVPGPQALLTSAFEGASPDGSRVFFRDMRALTAEDLDRCPSLYERAAGTTRLIAPNPEPPPYPVCESPAFGGFSGDGSHLFFVTGVDLEVGDEGRDDLYQQVGAVATRLTAYPRWQSSCVERPRFVASSADGRTIVFSTNAPVLPEDTNGTDDLYKLRAGGSFVLISKGTPAGDGCSPFGRVRGVALSADGGTTIFETSAVLSPADRDAAPDLYAAAEGGSFELLSTGPTDPQVKEPTTIFPDWLVLVSDDAGTVAFETRQRLVGADVDDTADVYIRVGGVTSLLSEAPPGTPAPNAGMELSGLAADGSAVVFATRAGLVAGDTNRERDYYLRRLGSKRPVLLSAESIPPTMRIARRAARLRAARVAVRLTCPKTERNGPCRGNLRLADGRLGETLGRSAFEIAVGERERIVVRLRRQLSPARRTLFARALGVDRLGNARAATRTLRLK